MGERPGGRRPTVHDVAREAGVSIATVSTSFSRPDKVRPETRRLVREAAARIGYVPNAAARSLVQGRTRVFGFMSFSYLDTDLHDDPELPLAGDPGSVPLERGTDFERSRTGTGYVEDVRRGVELGCMEHGYGLLLGGSGTGSRRAQLRDLLSRIDGLIVLPWAEPEGMDLLRRRRLPIVGLSDAEDEHADDSVLLDNEMGVRAMVEHLVCEHGRRRLMFLGDLVGYDARARHRGFSEALATRGLVPVPVLSARRADLEPGELGGHLAEVGEVPDAIVCANDFFAERVLEHLRALGLRVPEQVSVTGFDASLAGAFLDPPLTSLRGHLERAGRTAVRLLAERFDDPELPRRIERVPVSMHVRRSCGCPEGAGTPLASDIE